MREHIIKDIVKILECYGYELEFEQPEQYKTRYENENGFIDIWNGKKRITIGIYNPETKMLSYHRNPSLELIEREIIRVNK